MQGLTPESVKQTVLKVNMNFQKKKEYWVFLTSDWHIDNPKADRKLLFNHLDEAVRRDAAIIVNGDANCLMQGKGDPRGSKADLLPQHSKTTYIDDVVYETVDLMQPYAKNLLVWGYGNHETAIIKHRETDVVQRIVDLCNTRYNARIHRGGYGTYVRFIPKLSKTKQLGSKTLYSWHGAGGGGVMSMGVLQVKRTQSAIVADIYHTGHIHEEWILYGIRAGLDNHNRVQVTDTCHISTGTYKKEWDMKGGFHYERGRSPKPVGSAWLRFYVVDNELRYEVTPAMNPY